MEATMTEATTGWKRLCALDEIPVLGARVVRGTRHGDIAVFRTEDDQVFAIHDKCPHKGRSAVARHRPRAQRHLPAAQLEDRPRGRPSRSARRRLQPRLLGARR